MRETSANIQILGSYMCLGVATLQYSNMQQSTPEGSIYRSLTLRKSSLILIDMLLINTDVFAHSA